MFKPPPPLKRSARAARSVLVVVMLIGSLFPAPDGISWVAVATVVAVPVIAYELLRWLPHVHPVVAFVIPLFAILASSAIFIPPTSDYGINKVETFLTLSLASALAASLLRDAETVVMFGRVWLIAGLILSVFALFGYTGTGRADVFESNPIWLARAIASAAVIAVWLWWQKRAPAPLMLLALAILIGGIFASGSRGPLLGMTIGVVVIALVITRMKFRRVVTVLVLGAAATVALQTLPLFSGSRLDSVLSGDNSDQSRQLFWTITPPVIQAHPFGVGFGNWAYYAGPPPQFLWPHDIFLEVFTELGVPLGIFFVAMTTLVYVRLLRSVRRNPVALLTLGLLACETASVSVSGDLNARTFFFLLALGFLVGSKQKMLRSDGPMDARTSIHAHKRLSTL